MKVRSFGLALAVLALPAMAQDRSVSLFFDKAPGVDGTITEFGTDTHLKPNDFTGLGIKFGAAVAKWGPATLEFNASYRFKSKEQLTLTPTSSGNTFQYEWSYISAGADVNFTRLVDFGGGLDLRAQQSTFIQSSSFFTGKTGVNHMSPWLRLHAGYTFNTMPVKPFVALEGAWDLSPNDSHYTATLTGGSTVDDNKAYGVASPKSEYSLQMGLRF